MITKTTDKSLLVYNNPILFDKEENFIRGYLLLFKASSVQFVTLNKQFTDEEIHKTLESKDYVKCYYIDKNKLRKILKEP